MKFVHIADLHLDSPFTNLSEKGNLGDKRRLEQRNTLRKVINYCKENKVEYLFIAGDLYEHKYVKETTINYINSLFQEIPETQIFIVPGNHDPFVKGSVYESYLFSKNVYIFESCDIERFEDDQINLYAAAFTDFYSEENPLKNVKIEKNGKPNILLLHCDLNGGKDTEGLSYCPILESEIKQFKFTYAALGHIHKTNFEPNKNIIYPGSLISFGFDELGEHGMVIGEILDGNLKTEFIPLDERKFEELKIKVDKFSCKEELIEELNIMYLEPNTMYKIVLEGKRNFEIDEREILNLISSENILKVKDKTKLNYDIEKLSLENTLKGLFVREVLKKVDNKEITEIEAEKVFELVLNLM